MSDPKIIYLGPACQKEGDGREWCEDDAWPQCECGCSSVRYMLESDAQSELAALREELAIAKRVGPPHFCGLPMSLNPHPEAGIPGRFLEVGAVSECIPCLVSSRHGWAKTAGDLQQRLAAAEQRNSDQLSLLHMSKELLSTISLHRTMAPNDWCDSFKIEVANRLEKLRAALAKPTESGASE